MIRVRLRIRSLKIEYQHKDSVASSHIGSILTHHILLLGDNEEGGAANSPINCSNLVHSSPCSVDGWIGCH